MCPAALGHVRAPVPGAGGMHRSPPGSDGGLPGGPGAFPCRGLRSRSPLCAGSPRIASVASHRTPHCRPSCARSASSAASRWTTSPTTRTGASKRCCCCCCCCGARSALSGGAPAECARGGGARLRSPCGGGPRGNVRLRGDGRRAVEACMQSLGSSARRPSSRNDYASGSCPSAGPYRAGRVRRPPEAVRVTLLTNHVVATLRGPALDVLVADN
jgi:hypothetical protein